jgi:DNA-directed RNA polymerase specialized sigma24 family protein
MIRHLVFLHQHVRELFLKNCSPEIVDPDLRRLARALASLPDRQHEVFRLARFGGLRSEAIATALAFPRIWRTESWSSPCR